MRVFPTLVNARGSVPASRTASKLCGAGLQRRGGQPAKRDRPVLVDPQHVEPARGGEPSVRPPAEEPASERDRDAEERALVQDRDERREERNHCADEDRPLNREAIEPAARASETEGVDERAPLPEKRDGEQPEERVQEPGDDEDAGHPADLPRSGPQLDPHAVRTAGETYLGQDRAAGDVELVAEQAAHG